MFDSSEAAECSVRLYTAVYDKSGYDQSAHDNSLCTAVWKVGQLFRRVQKLFTDEVCPAPSVSYGDAYWHFKLAIEPTVSTSPRLVTIKAALVLDLAFEGVTIDTLSWNGYMYE